MEVKKLWLLARVSVNLSLCTVWEPQKYRNRIYTITSIQLIEISLYITYKQYVCHSYSKISKLISLPSLLFGSDLPYQDPLSQVFLVGVPLWWWVGGAEWWAKRRGNFHITGDAAPMTTVISMFTSHCPLSLCSLWFFTQAAACATF